MLKSKRCQGPFFLFVQTEGSLYHVRPDTYPIKILVPVMWAMCEHQLVIRNQYVDDQH